MFLFHGELRWLCLLGMMDTWCELGFQWNVLQPAPTSLPCSTTARHDNYYDRTTSSSWFGTTFHWNPSSHHVSIMPSRHSHLNSPWNRNIYLDCLYLYGFSGLLVWLLFNSILRGWMQRCYSYLSKLSQYSRSFQQRITFHWWSIYKFQCTELTSYY